MTENSKGVLIEPTKLFCLFYEDFKIAGCVKIYKKPRDTDSRGKYIPKHKRGPDVELFKGQKNSGTSPFIFYPSIGGVFINGSINSGCFIVALRGDICFDSKSGAKLTYCWCSQKVMVELIYIFILISLLIYLL